MKTEPWIEPTWTVDQVRKLGERIRSLVRTNKLTSVISSLLLVILMLELGVFMYLDFVPRLMYGAPVLGLPDWYFGVLFLTFMVAMVVYLVAGSIAQRLGRLIQVYRKVGVLVKLACSKCGRTSIRTWQKDDYVFKDEGTCACGGPKYVNQMYLMPLQLKEPLLGS